MIVNKIQRRYTQHVDLRCGDALYLDRCGFDNLIFPQVLYDTIWYFHILWWRVREVGKTSEGTGLTTKDSMGGGTFSPSTTM